MPLKKEVIAKYISPVFFETGSFLGDGIQKALKVGFPEIISIEVAKDKYKKCLERFKSNNNVKLYLGDVELMLWDLIKDINKQMTFWLDAHFSGRGTGKGLRNDPIIQELEIIKEHPIKNHIIMVDDLRNLNVNKVKEKLLEINPEYEFILENGHIKNDVLVAKV